MANEHGRTIQAPTVRWLVLLFGAVGLVICPVVAALFLTMWRIYSDVCSGLLLAAEESPDEG